MDILQEIAENLRYGEAAKVTFDDTCTRTTVDISAANVVPGSVTFNNSSKDFSVQGTKGIAGSAGLTKSGSRTVTLSNANTYTGTTTVSAGTLAYGVNNAVGTGPVTVNGALRPYSAWVAIATRWARSPSTAAAASPAPAR